MLVLKMVSNLKMIVNNYDISKYSNDALPFFYSKVEPYRNVCITVAEKITNILYGFLYEMLDSRTLSLIAESVSKYLNNSEEIYSFSVYKNTNTLEITYMLHADGANSVHIMNCVISERGINCDYTIK